MKLLMDDYQKRWPNPTLGEKLEFNYGQPSVALEPGMTPRSLNMNSEKQYIVSIYIRVRITLTNFKL
jgi:hypothetical protein